jgi:FkbM family methyltransferase
MMTQFLNSMDDEITLVNNFYFPKIGATNAAKQKSDWAEQPKQIASHSANKQVCIQAGGNVGYYTKVYADIFDTVYTFEPDPLNFFCLNKNVQNTNVIKFQSCLGDSHELVSLALPASYVKKGINIGTYHIAGKGNIPTLLIDDLNLHLCDLIHLDIEGFEINAINGARKTISKFYPTICLEINSALQNFKYSRDNVFRLMNDLEYQQIDQINEDYIFKHRARL